MIQSPPAQPPAPTSPPPQPQPSVIPLPAAASLPPQPQPNVVPPPAVEPVIQIPPVQPPAPASPPPQHQPNAVPPPVPEPVMQSPPPKPEIVVEPPPPPEPVITLEDVYDGKEITAEQIDTLFNREKDAANDTFNGKTLLIKGVVDKVFIRDQLDIRYIMLIDAKKKMTWSLRCTFNKEESSKVSRVQEGQAVVVQGKYEGVSKNIIFKDCVLV
ncbi:MAG: OB-fold protein [Dehalococcoidales bacterium]